jgi:AcrR family transcriptional regulator
MIEVIKMSKTPGPGLRERNKREKRSRILKAARELFEEHGFEHTTGRQICERAGVGTGTLFLYVNDKRELLLWVFEEDARRILAQRRLASGSPVDRWLSLLGPFLTLYARNPGLSASYVQELLFRPERPPELIQLNQDLRDAVGDIAREAQSAGDLRRDVDAEEITSLVVGQYAHLVQLWLGVGALGSRQVRTRLRRGLTLLMEGLQG